MGCYNDDLLFIHIPKCGGWSVKTYLKAHLSGVLLPDDEGSGLPIGHVPLRDIERFTGRSPNSFAKILAVIRNPYEQQLSQACYWATRYMMANGNHPHDIHTGLYLNRVQVMADWAVAQVYDQPFVWLPQHIDLDGFVADPRCDFHVWYEQHHAYHAGMSAEEQERRQQETQVGIARRTYHDYGGYYPYWLEVDGCIPENVVLLRQESLCAGLRRAIAPFAGGRELPELPVKNTSNHLDDVQAYYGDAGRLAVQRKFAWTFREKLYPRCPQNQEQPAGAAG